MLYEVPEVFELYPHRAGCASAFKDESEMRNQLHVKSMWCVQQIKVNVSLAWSVKEKASS